MCGLFGLIGPGVQINDLKALQSLGYVSELRGRHGTGIVQGRLYETSIDVETDKTSEDFAGHLDLNEELKFRSPTGRYFFNTVMDNLFLCHVRHATLGVINADNAHPFNYPNVVGMHNGTLRTREFMPGYHKGTEDWTDSACLYSAINSEGYKAPIERLTASDAFALVMVDKTEKMIRIVRNKERTLFWAVDRVRGVLWYASEASFLRFIADRHNLNLTEPKAFDVETVYSFRPGAIRAGVEPNWETEKVFIKAAPVAYYQRPGNTFQRNSDGSFVVNSERIVNVDGTPWDDDEWDYYQTYSYGGGGSEHSKPADPPLFTNTGTEDSDESSPLFDDLAELEDYEGDGSIGFNPETQGTQKPRIGVKEGIEICKKPRQLAKVRCIYCDKPMDLYEQYLGSDIDAGLSAHYNCGE